MAGTDDLSTILASPGGDQPPYAQGVIKQWDPDTFESIVTVHGRDLENLPVKSSVEALTYQEGDTVILARWSGSPGAPETWWIDGRAVIPGTGRGEDAIAFLTTALGSAVARAVIGQSVFFDFNQLGGQRDAFGSFGDLEISGSPDVGPTVTFDLDGEKFLAIWGADVTLNTLASTGDDAEGRMGLEITGPTPFSPTGVRSARNEFTVNDDQRVAMNQGVSMGWMVSGLSPGSYTVEAKYEVSNLTDELDDVRWASRWLVIFAF